MIRVVVQCAAGLPDEYRKLVAQLVGELPAMICRAGQRLNPKASFDLDDFDCVLWDAPEGPPLGRLLDIQLEPNGPTSHDRLKRHARVVGELCVDIVYWARGQAGLVEWAMRNQLNEGGAHVYMELDGAYTSSQLNLAPADLRA